MRDSETHDPYAPDARARQAILLFAILSGVLLLVAHEALTGRAEWFASPTRLTLWFTLAIAPPLFAALTVQRLGDRRFLIGVLGYTALLTYIAWYAGRAMQPETVDFSAVVWPYAWVLIASGHALTAWFSVWLSRTDFGYPRLFDAAWRQVSTLIQVVAYTGAFWLLLFLWGALFKALGIVFFEDLFETARFAYPVTSLVAGYGMVIARTRSSVGDAVHLRILALWRGLLPLAAVLALAFAAALVVQGVEPLWKTRHATQLLLSLVVALVALANSAYGKGGEAPLHPVLHRVVQAALMLLPVFVLLAGWALLLRWQQYGLSLDRLWAALSIAVASVYAVGYCIAAARRATPWLAGIAPVNRIASVFTATALLLTQTGVLDFRAITAHALRDRGDALKPDDLRYLRWQLGSPGLTALVQLQAQAGPARRAEITRLLALSQPDFAETAATGALNKRLPPGQVALPPGLLNLRLPPGQLMPPPQLLERAGQHSPSRQALPCNAPHECWLLNVDVLPGTSGEWLRLRLPASLSDDNAAHVEWTLFTACEGRPDWCVSRDGVDYRSTPRREALIAALAAGDFAAAAPELLNLRVGKATVELGR